MGWVKIGLGVWSLNGPDESSCFNRLSGLFSNWKIRNLQISWPRKPWNTSNFNCPCGHKRCRLAVVVRILIWYIYIYIYIFIYISCFFYKKKIISCNIYFGNFVFGLLLRSFNWVGWLSCDLVVLGCGRGVSKFWWLISGFEIFSGVLGQGVI